MNVLFANPPVFETQGSFNRPIRFPTYNYATPVMHPPLFLAYAASYIRSMGHDVSFIDAPVEGMGVANFISKAEKLNPDFVVFETSTPSFKSDARVMDMLKKWIETKAVFVGTHVSALPQQCMEQSNIDAVVMGEYEYSLAEYIENGGNGTKGICYRDNGKIIVNERRDYISNLDQLPHPARDLLPNHKYFDPILKNPFTFVLAGRGCPHRCIYCNWPQVLTGREYRHRSPENIVDELESIEKDFKFKSFLFNDDTFSADRDHTIRVCDEMIERGIGLEWGCYTRADNADEELLGKLKEAGCFLLKVGIESGNQQLLNNMKKGYKLERVETGIKLMKDIGFDVHGTFVFGMPGENWNTIRETIDFAKKVCPTTVQFSSAVPYPGTKFYDLLEENNYLLTKDWDSFMPLEKIFGYPDFPADDFEKAIKRAYREYYFRLKYVKIGATKFLTEPATVASNFKRLITLSF